MSRGCSLAALSEGGVVRLVRDYELSPDGGMHRVQGGSVEKETVSIPDALTKGQGRLSRAQLISRGARTVLDRLRVASVQNIAKGETP
jgi:hypothetical protein